MKFCKIFTLVGLAALLVQCTGPKTQTSDFSAVETVHDGKPVSVMLTCYSTTLIANGKNQTKIRMAVTDSLGRQIISATDSVFLYIYGEGTISGKDGKLIPFKTDSTGAHFIPCQLKKGVGYLNYTTGTKPDTVKIVARSKGLWEASHEMHTLLADFVQMEHSADQLTKTMLKVQRMIGADISFLPQLEDRGIKFMKTAKKLMPSNC